MSRTLFTRPLSVPLWKNEQTRIVAEWIDEDRRPSWKSRARDLRRSRRKMPPKLGAKLCSLGIELAEELREAALEECWKVRPKLHRELLLYSVSMVNWFQVAEAILEDASPKKSVLTFFRHPITCGGLPDTTMYADPVAGERSL